MKGMCKSEEWQTDPQANQEYTNGVRNVGSEFSHNKDKRQCICGQVELQTRKTLGPGDIADYRFPVPIPSI